MDIHVLHSFLYIVHTFNVLSMAVFCIAVSSYYIFTELSVGKCSWEIFLVEMTNYFREEKIPDV